MNLYDTALTIAEHGIVNIHAISIERATPHRTALTRFAVPTPMIEPDTTCVVLTGR